MGKVKTCFRKDGKENRGRKKLRGGNVENRGKNEQSYLDKEEEGDVI